MEFSRASGILLHPTSLPGRFPIGDLGPAAHAFVDFLTASGQSYWQTLPLGPVGDGGSPYASYSAFAGNTLLISPEVLLADGLIELADIPSSDSIRSTQANFKQASMVKSRLLAKAFNRFKQKSNSLNAEFDEFKQQESDWLDDYALFQALKDAHHSVAWYEWEPDLRQRDSSALSTARLELSDEVEAQKFFQFLFYRQWSALKDYAHLHGVKLIGDLPIFVAHDSADVWAHPHLFKLTASGLPTFVAGVPPDYFSETGQFWGNPLYDWDAMAAEGFAWWIARVRQALRTSDVVRFDHFRGYAACWEIPAGDKTAERGAWVDAPGTELFTAIRTAIGRLPIIAEDLGVITPDVDALRDMFGFPGMRVLQFAFGGDASSTNLPHNYHPNVVVYTGTHDNDTAIGWFSNTGKSNSTRDEQAINSEREYCLKYLNSNGQEIHWDFIRAALASVANTAIIPLQDLLGLDTSARMNVPNSAEGNWGWRFPAGVLTDELAARLKDLSQLYGRIQ